MLSHPNRTLFLPTLTQPGTACSTAHHKSDAHKSISLPQVPVLYYLSGLTCNDENFIQKAGAQRAAAKHDIALIAPDTSPRGLGVEGEADSWDFGVGAGFYVNATQVGCWGELLRGNVTYHGSHYGALLAVWRSWPLLSHEQQSRLAALTSGRTVPAPHWPRLSANCCRCHAAQDKWRNWRMYDYVTAELPALLASQFADKLDTSNASIFGHSMGGHGALVVALRNAGRFKSVSAFAPICNPTRVPWGTKAFSGYLGADESAWKQYDAVELMTGHSGACTGCLTVLTNFRAPGIRLLTAGTGTRVRGQVALLSVSKPTTLVPTPEHDNLIPMTSCIVGVSIFSFQVPRCPCWWTPAVPTSFWRSSSSRGRCSRRRKRRATLQLSACRRVGW